MNRFRQAFVALLAVLALALCPGAPALAQDDAGESGETSPVLQMIRADWDNVSEKLASLAEAIPEDKYGWAPAEGVRSVGEVIVHVAGPNVALTQSFLEGDDNPLEELGENPGKEDLLAVLNASIERVDRALAEMTEADLEGSYRAFGREMSGYRIVNILTTHSHEHLGQLIAYARSNGVVPPWSS